MTDAMPLRKPRGVARVFFQEILEGDRRKLEARSNDDPSAGGGARDLRVPHSAFGPLFKKFFPDEVVKRRRRGGHSTNVTLQGGEVVWLKKGQESSRAVLYEPPTDARPAEGRIGRIHDIPALADGVPSADEGRVFLLLVQEDDGKVYPHYVTAKQLQDPKFNREIAAAIRRCAAATPDNRAVRGYVDYVAQKQYCHG